MTRYGEPISTVPLHDTIHTSIDYSYRFAEFDAAIAAGATLDELYKLYQGLYPRRFMAMIVVWNSSRRMIEAHQQDAQNAVMRQKTKR